MIDFDPGWDWKLSSRRLGGNSEGTESLTQAKKQLQQQQQQLLQPVAFATKYKSPEFI